MHNSEFLILLLYTTIVSVLKLKKKSQSIILDPILILPSEDITKILYAYFYKIIQLKYFALIFTYKIDN